MSFINNVLSVVREISSTNEEQRQVVIKSTKRLAEGYMLDMFRTVDFVARVTTNMEKHDLIKLCFPSTAAAIKVMNQELDKAFTSPPAPEPAAEPTPDPEFRLKPKVNPWIPNREAWVAICDKGNANG
jgi:hypothetical protein